MRGISFPFLCTAAQQTLPRSYMLTQWQDELSENLHRREQEVQLACRGLSRGRPCSLHVLSKLVRHLGMTIIITNDGPWCAGHVASVICVCALELLSTTSVQGILITDIRGRGPVAQVLPQHRLSRRNAHFSNAKAEPRPRS